MERILKWLAIHPLINISRLERECYIPAQSVSKALRGDINKLSEKHKPALEKALKAYGYK